MFASSSIRQLTSRLSCRSAWPLRSYRSPAAVWSSSIPRQPISQRASTTKQAVDLAQTNIGGAFGGGVNNLALIAPNVSSSGGVGVGTGGSVGGQRPRNNNFVVDGVDNNDKSVTGPQLYVSPETVAEFSLLANQFSAEFGRSNGGQFITVTKTGTNEYHGTAYGFFQNRYLNALDNAADACGRHSREDCRPRR